MKKLDSRFHGNDGSGHVNVNAPCGFIMMKFPCVYILASQRNGTLYVGVTSDLVKRVWEHKNEMVEGFTKQYGVHMLVWYEPHDTMESAIQREKCIKKWNRSWKLALVEKSNPSWKDLFDDLISLNIGSNSSFSPKMDPMAS
jgi:putative endonuclease